MSVIAVVTALVRPESLIDRHHRAPGRNMAASIEVPGTCHPANHRQHLAEESCWERWNIASVVLQKAMRQTTNTGTTIVSPVTGRSVVDRTAVPDMDLSCSSVMFPSRRSPVQVHDHVPRVHGDSSSTIIPARIRVSCGPRPVPVRALIPRKTAQHRITHQGAGGRCGVRNVD